METMNIALPESMKHFCRNVFPKAGTAASANMSGS